MEPIENLQKRHIRLMQNSVKTLGHILQLVPPETAVSRRDGPNGWTILEVICHLRDFDGFFYDRVIMMLEQDHPTLPAYDHEQIAIDRRYNEQNLHQAYADLVASRERFVTLFKSLDAAQWSRTGIHPERNSFGITDAAIQVGHHDNDHLEQITRILVEGQS